MQGTRKHNNQRQTSRTQGQPTPDAYPESEEYVCYGEVVDDEGNVVEEYEEVVEQYGNGEGPEYVEAYEYADGEVEDVEVYEYADGEVEAVEGIDGDEEVQVEEEVSNGDGEVEVVYSQEEISAGGGVDYGDQGERGKYAESDSGGEDSGGQEQDDGDDDDGDYDSD